MNKHMKAVKSGTVTATNIIGLKKAINADIRRSNGWSIGRTAPKLQGAELQLILTAVTDIEPMVKGNLHDSGVKLLQNKRYARHVDRVADMVSDIASFQLIGFDTIHNNTTFPIYRCNCHNGSFEFYNIPWQSGGNGPVISDIKRTS